MLYTVAGVAAYLLALPEVQKQFWTSGETAQRMKNKITQTTRNACPRSLTANNGVAYLVIAIGSGWE